MGSKLIGFRVADDLAEGIETKAAEGGQSTSEYLRKLIDEDLYPGNGKQPSTQPKAELEELEETVGNIVDEHYNLSTQVDKLGKELERVNREATDGHTQLAGTLDKNTAEVHRIIPLVQKALNDLQAGLTGQQSELQHMTNDLDLVCEALDEHTHKFLKSLQMVGAATLSEFEEGAAMAKRLNKRVALAKGRRPKVLTKVKEK